MKSFTFRLTLWYCVLVSATTALLLISGGWLLHRQLMTSIELMHDVEGDELAGLLQAADDLTAANVARIIEVDADSDAVLFFLQVERANGAVVFRSENLGAAVLPESPDGDERWTVELPALGPVRISRYASGDRVILVGSRMTPVEQVLHDYARVSALLFAAAAALSLALGYGFSRLTLRPVRAIEQTARRIRADNLSERIPVPEGEDELSALSRLLNQMFDRLEAAFNQVQRFTADASHELKTPLALVRLNAEKLRPRVGDDPVANAALDELCEEIAGLHQIIENLLFLSKADSGALAVKMRPLKLAGWIDDFAEDARILAEDRGLKFVVARNEPGVLFGEPQLLRQLLLNLASNGLAVTPPGGTLTFDSHGTAAGWCWRMTDEGPGIPPDQVQRIFERFVRLAGSGSGGDGGGYGLGLAICRSIGTLHGARIHAENRTDRSGLHLVVTFPPDASETTGHAARSVRPAGV